MTQKEYERIREEVSKKYKDEIVSLTRDKQDLVNAYEEEKARRVSAENKYFKLKAVIESMPESMQSIVEIYSCMCK
jgi:hypothetical protein